MKKTVAWMLLLLLPVLASCHKQEQMRSNPLANSNGHVLIQTKHLYGVQAIHKDTQILPCMYEQIVYDEQLNCYLATKDNQTIIYDQTGIQQQVLSGTLLPSQHQKGPAYGIIKDDKLALMDGTGTVLTAFSYEKEIVDVFPVKEHTYYLLKQGERYGVVDETGTICIPFEMDELKQISSTSTLQAVKQEHSAIFRVDGTQLTDFLYDPLHSEQDVTVSEITYQEHIGYLISKDGKWGILDEEGKEKVPFLFTNLNPKTDVAGDENGFLIREQTTHYYEPSGKEKLNIPGKGELFYENRALVCKDFIYQLIDETGTTQKVFPDVTYMEQYQDIIIAYDHTNTETTSKILVYDLQGNIIISTREVYTILSQPQSPFIFLTTKEGTQRTTTAYDHQGKEQFHFNGSPSNGFTSFNLVSNGFLYYDKQEIGILSNQGDILVAPQYQSITEYTDFYLCTKDHHSVLLDKKTYDPVYESKEEVVILPFSS